MWYVHYTCFSLSIEIIDLRNCPLFKKRKQVDAQSEVNHSVTATPPNTAVLNDKVGLL